MDKFLENNWVLRTLALLLAIGVWSQVYPPTNPLQSRQIAGIPIAVTDVRHGTTATPSPPEVTVTVRGAESALSTFDPSTILVSVDAQRHQPGHYQLAVKVTLPAAYEVVAVAPKEVRIAISRQS